MLGDLRPGAEIRLPEPEPEPVPEALAAPEAGRGCAPGSPGTEGHPSPQDIGAAAAVQTRFMRPPGAAAIRG